MANSAAAYATGQQPAIFAGPIFWVLVAAWLICLGTWVMAEREYRRGIRKSADDLELELICELGEFRWPRD